MTSETGGEVLYFGFSPLEESLWEHKLLWKKSNHAAKLKRTVETRKQRSELILPVVPTPVDPRHAQEGFVDPPAQTNCQLNTSK